MKILCIGDSGTRGSVGVSYVKAIAAAHPGWKVENAGVNGEPITSIGKRLIQKLDAGNAYDVIVLQGGANDILLPTFAGRGFWFNKALEHCRRIGRNPLPDPADFGNALREILEATRSRTKAKIILTTIGCLNENLRGGLNDQRRAFNDVIRRMARQYGCRLADPSGPVDQLLSQRRTRDYFLESFFNTAFSDEVVCKVPGGADWLSRKRGLHVTIDGGHLNSVGADLFRRALEEQLLLLAKTDVRAGAGSKSTPTF
jgi:lysophospholipase L1-like esterase